MALWLDVVGCQPFIKHKDTWRVTRPSQPSLSCKLEVHDVFDRRNYVACHSLFDKCLGGGVCCSVGVAFTTRSTFCSSTSPLGKDKNMIFTSTLQLCPHPDKRHGIGISWRVLRCYVSVTVKGAFPFQVPFKWCYGRRGVMEEVRRDWSGGTLVSAVITGSLPAISLEIWASEPDKNTSRDTIAFTRCLSSSCSLAILFLFHCTFPL